MDAAKPIIILLHGALGSSKTFNKLVPQLAQEFTPLTLDFIGHGVHSASQQISATLLCDQLIEYITSKQIKSVSIFGYSLGGYIALMACIKRPDLFDKIITLATKFEWNNEIAAKEIEQLKALSKLTEEHPFKKQLLLHHHNEYLNCIHLVQELILDIGKQQYLNETTIVGLKKPVLLLLGALDKMVSYQETQQISNNLPHATLIILPETGHQFEKVNQDDLLKIIISF